jgi:hypothetical protein
MKVTIFIRDNTDNSDEAACKDIRGFCLRISARITVAKWLVSKRKPRRQLPLTE